MNISTTRATDFSKVLDEPIGSGSVLADVDPRIPVRLLTGPVRSGKTSVVQHMMKHPGRRRRVHIVPDGGVFERLSRSAHRPDERTAVLQNGSVCFLMRDCDVVEALNILHLRRMGLVDEAIYFDDVLIEVPVDVSPVVVMFQLHTDCRLALTYRFEAIADVVDMTSLRKQMGREPADVRMIARADVLILNKRDQLSIGDRDAVMAEVAAINPFALTMTSEHGCLDASRFMSWDPTDIPGNEQGCNLVSMGAVLMNPFGIEGPAKNAISCLVNNPMNSARSNQKTHMPPVRAVHLSLAGHADIFRVSSVVAEIAEKAGDHLYRLKCVTAPAAAEHPVLFQYVDGAFTPPAWVQPQGRPETRLTVVGRDFEPRQIMAGLAGCYWDKEAIARGEVSPF
jgi:G3E family GTPase